MLDSAAVYSASGASGADRHEPGRDEWHEPGREEGRDPGRDDGRAAGDDRVLELGRRQLTSWARLERLHCAIPSVVGERPRISFRIGIDLARFARTWLDVDAAGMSARVRMQGDGDTLRVAGRVTRGLEPTWFSLQLALVPGQDELGLVLGELLLLGPGRIEPSELLRSLGAPPELFRDRSFEPVQTWIRPFPLLAATLRQITGLALPGRGASQRLEVAISPERLLIDGEPWSGPAADREGEWPRLPRLTPSEQLERLLEARDWAGVRGLLSGLPPGDPLFDRGFFALVGSCPILTAGEHARVRRAAKKGRVEALTALITHLLLVGQPYRAIHWYRQLGWFAASRDPLTAWAAGEALRELMEGLVRFEPIQIEAGEGAAAGADEAKAEGIQAGTGTGAGQAGGSKAPTGVVGQAGPGGRVRNGDLEAAGRSKAEMPGSASRDIEERSGSGVSAGLPGEGSMLTSSAMATGAQPGGHGAPAPGAVDEASAGARADTAALPPAEALRQAAWTGRLTPGLVAATRESFEALEDWRGLLAALEAALPLSSRPEDRILLHHELAQVLVALGVPSRAAPHFEALLAANPEDSDSREFLRAHYAREGLHTQRIRLEASLARKLTGVEAAAALEALSADAARHELFELSRALLADACAANPTDASLLNRLTGELEPLEAWDPLIAAWKRRLTVLGQAAEKLKAGLKIAGYMRSRGDLEAAERLYRGILRTEPEHVEALEGLARVLEARESWPALAETLQQLSRLVGKSARVEIALRLAGVYDSRLGEPEIADGWYREALAESPQDARAARGVVQQLEARKDWGGLAAFLEKRLATVEEPAERRELLLYLGDVCLVRLQDQPRALACFQQAEALERSLSQSPSPR